MTPFMPCGHPVEAMVAGDCMPCRQLAAARAAIGFNGGGGEGVAAQIAVSLPDCRHLRPPPGETVLCESCGGKQTMLKVFGCAVLGKCLPTVSAPGYGFCGRCDHRSTGQARDLAGDGQA